jgi:integrase
VKDVDLERGRIIVRQGKGRKDRVTLLPERVKPRLSAHLDGVHCQHDKDVTAGFGRVPLPEALDRKYPAAGESWAWQFVFPAARLCRIRGGDRHAGFIFMSRRSSGQWRRRFTRRASRRGRPVTRSGIMPTAGLCRLLLATSGIAVEIAHFQRPGSA